MVWTNNTFRQCQLNSHPVHLIHNSDRRWKILELENELKQVHAGLLKRMFSQMVILTKPYLGWEIRSLEFGGLRSNSASNIVSHLTAGFQNVTSKLILVALHLSLQTYNVFGPTNRACTLQSYQSCYIKQVCLAPERFRDKTDALFSQCTIMKLCCSEHLNLNISSWVSFFFPEYFMFTQLVTATFLMRHVDEYIQNRSWLR